MQKNEARQKVKELYEKYPYPSKEEVTAEGTKYFAKWAAKIIGKDETYWKGKKVLELGCGTGELGCGLSLLGAEYTGIDFSKNSIKKAKKNSSVLKCKTPKFIEKDILELKEGELGLYDVVIALGSLHHTINAKAGFHIATTHLKEGGVIIVGLYNKYSRAKLRVKRIIIKLFAGNNIEKRIKIGKMLFGSTGSITRDADKYGQTHETYHSINEILKWFRKEKINFISSKPIFNKPILDEIVWLIRGKEAFFVMAGEKKAKKSNI